MTIAPPKTLTKAEWPPDYTAVYRWRQAKLAEIRADKTGETLRGAKAYYEQDGAAFVNHWLDTYDPRNAMMELPSRLPFVLFERQEGLFRFFEACIKAQVSGLVEKARDMGATWDACGFSVWMWLFKGGSSVGWGSRKEQLVDRIGDPDSIFEKMRMVIKGLPVEFQPAGLKSEHLTYMKFVNPENGATISGEAGDNIGRGGRKTIYFKDESAHYERPERIEASLGDNTNVQIDISSVNGQGTVFQRKREAGVEWEADKALVRDRANVFVMDWRHHPAKTQKWYDERRAKAVNDGLLHLFAQEVDRDAAASVEGVIIPAIWVQAAIDAHAVLGFDDSGGWMAALDVADGGLDHNAFIARKGVVVRDLDEWGERDVGATARRAINRVRDIGHPMQLQYDSNGVGAGVKSEANRLNDEKLMPAGVILVPWSASDEVKDPDGHLIPGDKNSPINRDFFQNFKAQGWWEVRKRFYATWRARNEAGFTWKPDDLISLPSNLPHLLKLVRELSQPVFKPSASLKTMVDKTPDGVRSPNLADVVIECFWPADSNLGVQFAAVSQPDMRSAFASLGRMNFRGRR